MQKSIKQRLGAIPGSTTNRVRGALTPNRRLTSSRGVSRARGNRTRGQPVATIKAVRARGTKIIRSQTITRGGAAQSTRRNIGGSAISPAKRALVNTSNRSPSKSPRARGTMRGARRGGRGQATSGQVVSQPQRGRGRGRGRGQRGGRSEQRGRGNFQTTTRGRSPGRGRGRGRGRGGATKLSKEDLDKQLDQYMSKTRGALDQDIETYMSKIGDVEMS